MKFSYDREVDFQKWLESVPEDILAEGRIR